MCLSASLSSTGLAFYFVEDGAWFVLQCRPQWSPPPMNAACETDHSAIERVVIARSEVHDGVFADFLRLPNLRELKLYDTHAVSYQGYTRLFASSPLLRSVTVGDELFSNVSIFNLATYCPNLESVSLGDHCAERLTDFGIVALARHCTRLHTLQIGTCDGVSALALVHLVRTCTSLEHLRFDDGRLCTAALVELVDVKCLGMQYVATRRPR